MIATSRPVSHLRYYPAIYVGDFVSAQAALNSLGVTGDEGAFVASGIADNMSQPEVFECIMTDNDGDMTRSAVVLMMRPGGLIGLWFGLFAHLRDTPEGALNSLVDELLAGEPDDPPTVDVFAWVPPQNTIQ